MRRFVLLLVLVPAVLMLSVGSATASCLLDERELDQIVATAPVMFVGTVLEVASEGRTARFEVEEVWSGDVPAELVVHGGPEAPDAATSVDRSFEAGTRYLVAPRVEGGRFVDDSCSPTRPFDDEVAAARPAAARAPDAVSDAAGVDDDGGLSPLVPVTGAILLLAAAAGVAAFRAGRRDA